MAIFCIIETENGRTIVELPPGTTATEAAQAQGGFVVDPGPYASYEEAYEALLGLEQELADDGESEFPGNRAWEGRYDD